MLSIRSNYGDGSASSGSDTTSSEEESEKVHSSKGDTDVPEHLKPPVESSLSVAKTLSVCAAPDVIPYGAVDVARVINPHDKEIIYNAKYEELFAPVKGPQNPNLTQQMRAQRNTLAGYVEKTNVNQFDFENQRRTFHTYGYAIDPSVDPENDGCSHVGDLQAAYDDEGKTVFEPAKPQYKKKRKQLKNDNPEDVEGFLGPWGRYENEQCVAKPNEEQKAEIEAMLSKRKRRGRITEDKPFEEKSILHSKYSNGMTLDEFLRVSKSTFSFCKLQLKTPTTIRDVRIYMRRMIWM